MKKLSISKAVAEWGLKAGIAVPAASVFLKLAPVAKKHDGLQH